MIPRRLRYEEAFPMLLWGRFGYLVALVTLVTLPFDPLLNRPHIVLPLCVLCSAVGLVGLYHATLPRKSRRPRERGVE